MPLAPHPGSDMSAQKHRVARERKYLLPEEVAQMEGAEDITDVVQISVQLRRACWERLTRQFGPCGSKNGEIFSAADEELLREVDTVKERLFAQDGHGQTVTGDQGDAA